ncbi:transporter substrate-binding domain-containing protein [Paroceanicella profunda]|uniref:transporter substrate-binding domain-containing protein n=1 Tax=Paroceanicella profunda TaxID=2579971 RepID=UPI0019826C0F|nr:transporter substrate-binding domain-containing protein [Paroceanicella profunda]
MRCAFLIPCVLLCGLLAGAVRAGPLEFSDEERAWVRANPRISLGVVSDNEPYSFFRNGQIMGWTIDVLHRLEAETGLTFTLRMGAWPEVYGQFREGALDAIADISLTEEREAFINFTEAYHLRRTVLFHNVDHPLQDPENVTALRAQRIGVIKDIYYAGALRAAGIEPVEYDSYRDLMAAVAFGWIDAAAAAEMTGNFFARENGFSNVALAGALPLSNVSLEDFRLGVLKAAEDRSREMLSAILDKAVARLPAEDLAAITERWLTYRTGRTSPAGPLRLLPEEQAFVENAPPLKIGFISDYEPFSFLSQGRGQGLAVDLAHDISAQTGLVFDPVYDNWSNLLTAFQQGDIDIIANISRTEARSAYTLFSQEYHRIPNAVFVRSGFGPYEGIGSLAGKTVGIGRDIYYARELEARMDHVRSFPAQDEILKALSRGEIDAAILALSNGNAIVRRLGLINIEIGGEFLMDGVEREDLRFGVLPKYPYLKSIIDRAMSAMPLSRWGELETRWLGPTLAEFGGRRAALTTEERAYLDGKGVIKVCVDPLTPPYTEVDEDGGFTGVAAEVMARLAERGGLSWQVVPVPLRDDALAGAQQHACDVLPFALRSPSLEGEWTFTPPYLLLPMAVANRLPQPFMESMRELAGQRVGVVPGRSPLDLLRRRYPEVTLVEVESEEEGLRQVRKGGLDATLGTLASMSYLITTGGDDDLKISGRIAEDWQAAVATRADEPLLGQIFDKLVAGLGEQDVQNILNHEMLVRFEKRADYALLFRIAAVAVVLLLVFLYWNRKLHALNVALNAANARLREVSVTDGLTGLYNRMQFDIRGAEEFGLCQRNGWLFSIAMIDVDHFKGVNDEMGHVYGDACLRHVAGLLRRYFQRDGDLVARYGGEEFAVFTMGGAEAEFAGHLEMMRRGVAETPFENAAGTRWLTVSIGCHSAVPERGQTLADFVKRADARLYEAKHDGRNRLVAGSARVEPAGSPVS